MTPTACAASAIEILDRALAGAPAEAALTTWARANRFAGSGDRAAIRDLVYAALRCRRSFGWLGGGADGRALILGKYRAEGLDPEGIFTGDRHAPAPLTEAERASADLAQAPRGVRLDCPDWMLPLFDAALGADADATLAALQARAPVFLRVNAARATRDAAQAALAAEGIGTRPSPLANFALEVTENARKIQASQAYLSGLVELQDAASQAAVEMLGIRPGMRVLDYCAGGGGKALAMAALGAEVTAHDAAPQRMRDLPARAARAGVRIAQAATQDLARLAPFDLVVLDVPCSGSGTWRRTPEAKWALTPDRLADLVATQAQILAAAPALTRGEIAYFTCSLFLDENRPSRPGWQIAERRQWTPAEGADGFFAARLVRA